MKAAFLLVAVAATGAALWFSGVFSPAARHLLITESTASPMGNGAAAVLTIDNQGAPDQLVAVSSPTATVMLHGAEAGLPIQTGTSSLATDAAHIMIRSDTPFEDGALIPVTLTFANAGDTSVNIRYATPNPDSMAAHSAMGHGTMQHDVGDGPQPTVSLSVERVENGWLAQIETTNFTFSEAMQDGDHVDGTGHGHIYLGGMKLGRVFTNSYSIGALPSGQHILRVSLNTNDHRAYAVDGTPVEAETIITVD
ncbi:copper chaperone PCu(A)C [Roseobacter cerasinus]|nr:copper chaperone PCu(A)C [Roseobacter cerasinus]